MCSLCNNLCIKHACVLKEVFFCGLVPIIHVINRHMCRLMIEMIGAEHKRTCLLWEHTCALWIDFCISYMQKKFKCNWFNALFHVFIWNFLNTCVIECLLCSALNDTLLSLRHTITIESLLTAFTNDLKCLVLLKNS